MGTEITWKTLFAGEPPAGSPEEARQRAFLEGVAFAAEKIVPDVERAHERATAMMLLEGRAVRQWSQANDHLNEERRQVEWLADSNTMLESENRRLRALLSQCPACARRLQEAR